MDVLENEEVKQHHQKHIFPNYVSEYVLDKKTFQELQELFKSIDTDGSDSLTLPEVILFLKVSRYIANLKFYCLKQEMIFSKVDLRRHLGRECGEDILQL